MRVIALFALTMISLDFHMRDQAKIDQLRPVEKANVKRDPFRPKTLLPHHAGYQSSLNQEERLAAKANEDHWHQMAQHNLDNLERGPASLGGDAM